MNGLEAAAVAAGASMLATAPFVRAMLNPRSQLFGPVVWRGPQDTASPACAITFDDGPWPASTVPILETLASLNVRATFFVIGRRAAQFPDLVRRIHDDGHLVANHSYDHSHLCMFGLQRYWRDQIERTDGVIGDLVGRRPVYFRPPLGIRTWAVDRASRATGHTLVTWTRRALDGMRTSTERLMRRLGPRTLAGDILGLHDGIDPHTHRDPQPTVAAVAPLITALRARGLEPLRLDTLLQRTSPALPSEESMPM